MRSIPVLLTALAAALPLGALADDAGEAAVKKNGCLKCHSVSADKGGPSFKKSAAKYKGEPGKIEAFLKAGNKHPAVKNDAEAKSIAAYVLSR